MVSVPQVCKLWRALCQDIQDVHLSFYWCGDVHCTDQSGLGWVVCNRRRRGRRGWWRRVMAMLAAAMLAAAKVKVDKANAQVERRRGGTRTRARKKKRMLRQHHPLTTNRVAARRDLVQCLFQPRHQDCDGVCSASLQAVAGLVQRHSRRALGF